MFLVWFVHYVRVNLYQAVDTQCLKLRGPPRLKSTELDTEFKYFMMPWFS